MLADIHFMRPWWLILIPLSLIALVVLTLRKQHAKGAWVHLVDAQLQPYVLGQDVGRTTRDWSWLLAWLALCIGFAALAGPAWERQSVPLSRTSDAMIIALDLSRSMDATDVAPSRLARARLKLLDILRERKGGETGLVVYSANAFVVTPLTTDVGTIEALVPSLDTSMMPSRGSYPDSAIEKALQLFAQSDVVAGRILLIADGGNVPPAMTAINDVRAAGHTLSVLAVGTAEGGPIPQPRGGFLTDGSGNIALPKLQQGPLRRLASAGGGRFSVLSSNAADLDALELGVSAASGSVALTDDDALSVDRWLDRGPWLIVLLLPLIALAFRRGGYAMVVLFAVAVAPRAEAGFWQDLWSTPDQQAAKLLESGDPKAAAEQFEDPAWQATARYRAGEFDGSAEQFSLGSDADARYNAGTAFARAGDLKQAIEQLQAALDIDPEHEDARFNLDLLEQISDQNEQSQGEGEPDGEGEQNPDGAAQDGETGDSESSANSQSDGNGTGDTEDADATDARAGDSQTEEQRQIEALQEAMRAAEAEAQENGAEPTRDVVQMTQEQREAAEAEQALEQWLRRVEDDPGGLLRRKFRYQYQRRQTDQDGVRLWPDDRSEPW
ncbi:MAG: VWA domain-containing protein [Pseudomonadota bacterium]